MKRATRYNIVFISIPRRVAFISRREIQRRVPMNFWKWSKKARFHYIIKRWKKADAVFDGRPGGRFQFI